MIEVSYCGGCGWSVPARKVCDAIKAKLPKSVIDCRPEEVFTGVLEVHLLIGETNTAKEKRFIYRGNKDTVLADIENITQKVEEVY